MSFPPTSHPGGPGFQSGTPRPAPRTPGAGALVSLALDNMLRNQLKVRDPNNAREVAEGLLAYYQGTPQADGIAHESQVLPFLHTRAMAPSHPPQASSSDTEL